jgi:hypothetical protein
VRAAFAPIHAVIFSVAASLASGCGAASHGTPIGMSDAAPEKARESEVTAAPAPWPDFAAARAWPEAAPPFVALAHRRDGTLIHVRVAPDGLAAYRDLSSETVMPDGARVMAWHEAPGGALLGGYLLEKRGGLWSAQQLDAKGSLIPGDRSPCVRCHDMAPTDHLFGVRAAPPPPAPVGSGESIVPAPR